MRRGEHERRVRRAVGVRVAIHLVEHRDGSFAKLADVDLHEAWQCTIEQGLADRIGHHVAEGLDAFRRIATEQRERLGECRHRFGRHPGLHVFGGAHEAREHLRLVFAARANVLDRVLRVAERLVRSLAGAGVGRAVARRAERDDVLVERVLAGLQQLFGDARIIRVLRRFGRLAVALAPDVVARQPAAADRVERVVVAKLHERPFVGDARLAIHGQIDVLQLEQPLRNQADDLRHAGAAEHRVEPRNRRQSAASGAFGRRGALAQFVMRIGGLGQLDSGLVNRLVIEARLVDRVGRLADQVEHGVEGFGPRRRLLGAAEQGARGRQHRTGRTLAVLVLLQYLPAALCERIQQHGLAHERIAHRHAAARHTAGEPGRRILVLVSQMQELDRAGTADGVLRVARRGLHIAGLRILVDRAAFHETRGAFGRRRPGAAREAAGDRIDGLAERPAGHLVGDAFYRVAGFTEHRRSPAVMRASQP